MFTLNHRLLRAAWRVADWANRRFTAAGLLVIAALVLAAVSGVDTGLTLAYQLFAYLVALLVVAWLASLRLAGRYRVERRLPRHVTVGEEARYRVLVHNDGTRPVSGLVLLERCADPRPAAAELRARLPGLARFSFLLAARRWQALVRGATPVPVRPHALPTLPAGGSGVATVRFLPERRGRYRLDGVTLARREPLGLCRALRHLHLPQALLVLPRRYPVPPLHLPGRRTYQPGGVTLAAGIGDSEEFIGLRDYRPGDPLQWIHWKSFARVGHPVVREYQSEYFERHALVLDTFTAHADARFEEAVAVAASFAATIDTSESLLDLLFVGRHSYRYTAGRGQLRAEGLLEVLAEVMPRADGDFDELAHAVETHAPRLASCILVLLGWDERRRALHQRLRAAGLGVTTFVVIASDDERGELAPGVHRLAVGRVATDLAASAAARGAR